MKFIIYLLNRFSILRKKVEYIKLFKLLLRNNFQIYIRNHDDFNFLSSFTSYIDNGDKLSILKTNLDEKSLKKINNILNKIKLLTQNNILKFNDIYQQEDIENAKNFADYLKDNLNNPFPINSYYLSKTKHDYDFNLNGKDIIDLGACDGDSSITFSNVYENSRVLAFEPESNNFIKLNENIKTFNKEDIVIPVKLGVADYKGTVKFQGTGAGASIGGQNGEEIELTTIDKYVFDNDLNPGMIKWDIEGLEYASIIGAEKTIKRFKPILFISIYHTGKDFFEIKPLIESWDLGYRFGIEKWHNGHPFADTVLICY